MAHKHLTQEDRYHISGLIKSGNNNSEIAKELEKHKSKITRELSRNAGLRGYRSPQANYGRI